MFLCALHLWFLELSWCEALSLKFAEPYYVDFSVNYQTGKAREIWYDASHYAVLRVWTFIVTYDGPCDCSEIPDWNHFDIEKLIFTCHMDVFFEIFKKLNWDVHNWSNHYFFEFSASILLWFGEAWSSESNFMESLDFLAIGLCSRLTFSKKMI